MDSSTIIVLVVACVVAIILAGVFWFVEKVSKSEQRAKSSRVKEADKPKTAEPVAEVAVAPTPASTVTSTSSSGTVPQAQDGEKKDEERQVERVRQKQRYTIMNYHRDKWNPNTDLFDYDGEETQGSELTKEDMRKIIALKDLFERKGSNPNKD